MLRKYRVVLLLIAAFLLIALWYAFRPEKLFINHKVDEPPPSSRLLSPQLEPRIYEAPLPAFVRGA